MQHTHVCGPGLCSARPWGAEVCGFGWCRAAQIFSTGDMGGGNFVAGWKGTDTIRYWEDLERGVTRRAIICGNMALKSLSLSLINSSICGSASKRDSCRSRSPTLSEINLTCNHYHRGPRTSDMCNLLSQYRRILQATSGEHVTIRRASIKHHRM